MYMDHSLPKRTILEISFLSTTDFYNISLKIIITKLLVEIKILKPILLELEKMKKYTI